MIVQLKKYLDCFVKLSETELTSLSGIISHQNIRKKEHLVLANHVCKKIAFFTKGYFRFYQYKSDGTEVTSDFYFAPNLVASYTSLILQQPSNVNVQAMEDIELLTIRYDELQKLYTIHHKLERLGRILSEQVFINTEKHLMSLLTDPAEKRYQYLLKEYPEFVKNIPLQYIASYLGIKPETLSRIRKKTG